ncbi:MAG: hypothetical protein IJU71_06040 [Selenomonadaceae bacterium]|nr:hypothetical protein [Selenomonadaceae bacterium]
MGRRAKDGRPPPDWGGAPLSLSSFKNLLAVEGGDGRSKGDRLPLGAARPYPFIVNQKIFEAKAVSLQTKRSGVGGWGRR